MHFWQVLNFFLVEKLIFGHILNCKKMEFGPKKFFREIDLFDFMSFFAMDFLIFWYTMFDQAFLKSGLPEGNKQSLHWQFH